MSQPDDWRCWIGVHRWTKWQVEQEPSPYIPDWAMSWRTCQRCGMWEWKPSVRERVVMFVVSFLLLSLLLSSVVIGLVKVVEWVT